MALLSTKTGSPSSGGSAIVEKTGAYTAVSGDRIAANTSGGAFTITLPASPSVGAIVTIFDAQSTWGSLNLTVGRNGSNIEASATDLTCNSSGAVVELVYCGGSRGWGVFV